MNERILSANRKCDREEDMGNKEEFRKNVTKVKKLAYIFLTFNGFGMNT